MLMIQAGHFSKCCTYVVSFCQQPTKIGTAVPLYVWGNWGTEKLSYLLALGPLDSKWYSWYLDPGDLTPEPVLWTCCSLLPPVENNHILCEHWLQPLQLKCALFTTAFSFFPITTHQRVGQVTSWNQRSGTCLGTELVPAWEKERRTSGLLIQRSDVYKLNEKRPRNQMLNCALQIQKRRAQC